MKINFNFLAIFLIGLFLPFYSNATVFTSIASGNGEFDSPGNWDVGGGQIPGEMDDVIIKHPIRITLNNKITIKSLTLINDGGSSDAIFETSGNDTLVVLNNVEATLVNVVGNIRINTIENSTLIINGNCHFTRVNGNSVASTLNFNLFQSSKVFVKGSLIFDYLGSDPAEWGKEIELNDSTYLDVLGETRFTNSAGHDFNLGLNGNSHAVFRDSLTIELKGTGSEAGITLHDQSMVEIFSNVRIINSSTTLDYAKIRVRDVSSHVYIQDDLHLISQGAKVKIEAEGSEGVIRVKGDIVMDAAGKDQAFINIIERGKVFLGGDIIRKTAYGNLVMKDDAALVLNGNTPQIIPSGKLAGSETDSLDFRKIIIENSSGFPLTLADNFIIRDTLELSTSKIMSSKSEMVILADSAVISGGNENAYIVGPVKKEGRTNTGDLFLPVGTDSKYAPITLSPIMDAGSEVIIQYYSAAADPPPFGNDNNEPGLNNIMTEGYWNVEKNAATGDLNIELHWTDAAAQGINDMSSLVVAGYNSTSGLVESYGQEGTTGGIGSGTSGSVTNSFADPPPFGTQNFVFGSTSALNSLPVDITKFYAVQDDKDVFMHWETASELNVKHFEVEHSIDAINFSMMKMIMSSGDLSSTQYYSTTHSNPPAGFNYYRLKIINQDGSIDYSHVEIVKFDSQINFNIYPNPVKEFIKIQGDVNYNENPLIEVFDRNGKLLFSSEVKFENGYMQLKTEDINIKESGVYFIRINSKKDNFLLKLIKTE